MNYTKDGLRGGGGGGGGCCKNKNKTFARNSVDDEESLTYEESYPDFSPLNNDFSELEDFESTKDDEQARWNITQDDSFTMLTGKYESMNRDCLLEEDDEEDDFLDQYLLSMSPIIDKKTKERDREKGKKGTTPRTVPRRPHDVSVKCSDSTEEIVGTPSEVALRLNEAIQHYLPRRKIKIEKEVSKEVAGVLDEEFEKNPEEESVENLCPEEEPLYIPEQRGCPGIYDRFRKQNVSCADASSLREIALGRRIKRPNYVLPIEEEVVQPEQPTPRANGSGEKESCCCSKTKKQAARKNSPPPPKSCCTKQPRSNKSVSFSF